MSSPQTHGVGSAFRPVLHTVSTLGIALQHFWHKACPVHECGARSPPQGYGTGTGDTSNLSAGMNSHFSALLRLPLAEPIAWGSAVFHSRLWLHLKIVCQVPFGWSERIKDHLKSPVITCVLFGSGDSIWRSKAQTACLYKSSLFSQNSWCI